MYQEEEWWVQWGYFLTAGDSAIRLPCWSRLSHALAPSPHTEGSSSLFLGKENYITVCVFKKMLNVGKTALWTRPLVLRCEFSFTIHHNAETLLGVSV